jgi:hypothetical protein
LPAVTWSEHPILRKRQRRDLRIAVGNLCVGVDGDSRYDARRIVGLLVAGLRQSHPASQ